MVICGSSSGSFAISGGGGGGSGSGSSRCGGAFCAVAPTEMMNASETMKAMRRGRTLRQRKVRMDRLILTSNREAPYASGDGSGRSRIRARLTCFAVKPPPSPPASRADLKVQHLVAFSARRLEAAALIIVEDGFDDHFRFFDDLHQIEIV